MPIIDKWGHHVARTVLGFVFVVFGANYFLHFLPNPPPPPERALTFVGGLMAAGYLFPLMKSIEVAAGIALLANRFVPLALTLLAPIIVNIVAFHFVLAPTYSLPLTILLLEVYLAWRYRDAFAPMLRGRVVPGGAAADEVGADRVDAYT